MSRIGLEKSLKKEEIVLTSIIHRKVLIEKLTSLSNFIKKEQKNYQSINVRKEIFELLKWSDLPGIYIDDKYKK